MNNTQKTFTDLKHTIEAIEDDQEYQRYERLLDQYLETKTKLDTQLKFLEVTAQYQKLVQNGIYKN